MLNSQVYITEKSLSVCESLVGKAGQMEPLGQVITWEDTVKDHWFQWNTSIIEMSGLRSPKFPNFPVTHVSYFVYLYPKRADRQTRTEEPSSILNPSGPEWSVGDTSRGLLWKQCSITCSISRDSRFRLSPPTTSPITFWIFLFLPFQRVPFLNCLFSALRNEWRTKPSLFLSPLLGISQTRQALLYCVVGVVDLAWGSIISSGGQ